MLKKLIIGASFLSPVAMAQAQRAASATAKGSPLTLLIMLALIAYGFWWFKKRRKNNLQASRENIFQDNGEKNPLRQKDRLHITNIIIFIVAIFLVAIPFFYRHMLAAYHSEQSATEFFFVCCIAATLFLIYKCIAKIKRLKSKSAEDYRLLLEKIKQIGNGQLPQVVPVNTILRPGEQACFSGKAQLIENRKVGYTIRSDNWLYFLTDNEHFKVSRVLPINKKIAVSVGELVITNKRILFAGNHKSVEIFLSQLINMNITPKGIALHMGMTSHVFALDEFDAKLISVLIHHLTNKQVA